MTRLTSTSPERKRRPQAKPKVRFHAAHRMGRAPPPDQTNDALRGLFSVFSERAAEGCDAGCPLPVTINPDESDAAPGMGDRSACAGSGTVRINSQWTAFGDTVAAGPEANAALRVNAAPPGRSAEPVTLAQNIRFPGPIWKLMLEPNWPRALRTKLSALLIRDCRWAAVGAAMPAAIWVLACVMLA